jgi:hypothetical protein
MNKRPGQLTVTTEVGFCNFCGRARNLRREEHKLGTLVRTVITCESCHRTLSSSMGIAGDEPATPAPPEVHVSEAPAAEPSKPAPSKPARKKSQATPKTKAVVAKSRSKGSR